MMCLRWEITILDPLSAEVRYLLGLSLLFARQYDMAVQQYQEAMKLNPSAYFPVWGVGLTYEARGNLPEALAWLKKARQLEDNPLLLAQTGGLYARLGDRKQARMILEELKRRSSREHVPAVAMGTLYFYLGEKDKAFRFMDQAFDERGEDLLGFKSAPWLDPMRSDPRFQNIVRRMNFPN